ncbi:MAG: hypothetical protein M3R63_18490 [Actinomycetota bacterium]|nr:hypothetical protein [Actinomycetota bacterium]
MAITTLDGHVAGMRPPEDFLKVGAAMEAAGIRHSLLYTPGAPGAAVAPSPGLNGAALTSYAGQLPFTNPTGGALTYLARLEAMGTLNGTLALLDRLWHNSGIVVSTLTAQAITHPGIPARDRDGTNAGAGVEAALEVSIATTNAGAITNTTISYTNSAGVGGRTGTIASFPATAVAGTFVPFQLQAGDVGIRSIQSITLGTSYVGGSVGAVHLVQYRKLAAVGLLANVAEDRDLVQLGAARLYDNTVPFLVWLASAVTAVTVEGLMTVSQG